MYVDILTPTYMEPSSLNPRLKDKKPVPPYHRKIWIQDFMCIVYGFVGFFFSHSLYIVVQFAFVSAICLQRFNFIVS